MMIVIEVDSYEMVLMIGYHTILKASEEARGHDFSESKRDTVDKFDSNPLSQFFLSLSDFLVMPSAEATDMIRTKAHSRSSSPRKKAKVSNDETESYLSEESPPLPSIGPILSTPPPSSSSENKRVFSGESYGHISTETTPTKIVHPEPMTQSLQDELMKTLIHKIWRGEVQISWARNRKMYMDYRTRLVLPSVSSSL
jgi:hypothetical protein